MSTIVTPASPTPAPLFSPKYFLGLSGDYSFSDLEANTQSPSPSPAPRLASSTSSVVKRMEKKDKEKEKEDEKELGKMNRAARREGKRKAWAEAHGHLPTDGATTPAAQNTPLTLPTTLLPSAIDQPKPKPNPKRNVSHLPPRIQHLLLPLPVLSPLRRARVRHRFLTRRQLAGVRDSLLGRRRALPDAPAVEKHVGVDLDEVLRERLRLILEGRRKGLETPHIVTVENQAQKEEEDDDLDAVEEQITFYEKPVPFFKQRPRSPTSSNPIIYPRGHVSSPHPQHTATTSAPVEVEIIKPKWKPLITAQGMLKKVLERPGCLFGLAEKERKWVRRMAGAQGEEELERLLRGGEGEVVWEEGVGRIEGAEVRKGEEEEVEEGNVHVFLDHSNIHLTMLNTVSPRYSSPTRHSDTESADPTRHFSPFTKKYLSLPLLTLLLTRGRSLPPNALHLVASAPLMQNLDQAVKNGWKCAVLQRVEVAKEKGGARKFVREDLMRKKKMLWSDKEKEKEKSDTENHATSGGETDTGKKHSIKTAKSEDEQEKVALPSLDDPTITSRRMREQAVDELLQLKMLQTILVTPSNKTGTIVLCTGDAAPGQFNDLGFLGCTRLAIERGWRVELWSWKKGLSRLWREEAKGSRWSRRQFEIMYLDDWAAEVVEEKAE